jgi:hypothetical protein
LRKVVFSSTDLPAELDDRARFSRWVDILRQTLGRRNIIRTADRPFSAWSESIQFGPVAVGRNRATIVGSDRTPGDVAADGIDKFMLSLNAGADRISYQQCSRETVLEQGSWTMLSLAEGFHIRWGAHEDSGEARWLNLVVPRRPLVELVATVEDLVVTRLDGSQGPAQHLQR